MFQFDADIATIDSGVWAPYGGAEFLIAHTTNLKFQRALARLQQPYRRKLEQGNLDPKVNRDIFCQAMAEAILLDWRNVVDKDKQPVEFSPEKAKVALLGNPDFRDFVSEYAANMANFRKEEVDELGNS